MSDIELLIAIGGVMVAVTGGIVVPLGLALLGWMNKLTKLVGDIRVNQGRHDERLDDSERRHDEHDRRNDEHDSRLSLAEVRLAELDA